MSLRPYQETNDEKWSRFSANEIALIIELLISLLLRVDEDMDPPGVATEAAGEGDGNRIMCRCA